MAVADVYDALISRRVYKAAMPHEQAVQIDDDGVWLQRDDRSTYSSNHGVLVPSAGGLCG